MYMHVKISSFEALSFYRVSRRLLAFSLLHKFSNRASQHLVILRIPPSRSMKAATCAKYCAKHNSRIYPTTPLLSSPLPAFMFMIVVSANVANTSLMLSRRA